MMKSTKLIKLMILLGIAGGLQAQSAVQSAAQSAAQRKLLADAINRNAYVEIEFDNLADFRKWSEPDPEECLGELKEEVEEIESIVEEVLSIVDALELETCPVTLIHQSDIVFNVPFVITASGRYCLAEDLTITCSVGLIIEGSGVTLDLNGHTIFVNLSEICSGDGVGVEVRGDAAVSDIVIKNGTITSAFNRSCFSCTEHVESCVDYYDDSCTEYVESCVEYNEQFCCFNADQVTGIWLNGCDSDTEQDVNFGASCLECVSYAEGICQSFVEESCCFNVVNVRIENVAFTNLHYGVYVEGAVGTVITNAAFQFDNFNIYCIDDSATTITNSMFVESGPGISYCGSHNMIVRDCSFSGLCGSAITGVGECDPLDVAEFTRCIAAGIDDDAFSIANASSVVFTDCTATENCGIGFNLTDSVDVVFRDCIASNNGPDDCYRYSGPHGNGFDIEICTDVCLYNCFAQDNRNNGFNVVSSTVLMRNCTATDNGDYGFTDDADNTNQYYANYACGNGGPVVDPNDSANYNNILFASVTSPDNTRGVHNVDCSNSAVDQIDAIESIVENISVVVDAVCSCSLIEAIVTDIDEQLFALSSAVDELAETSDDCSVKIITVPTTITKSGRYCLAKDITGTITIAASSIILDLNGHTIYGVSEFGIDLMGTSTIYDITIKNGSLVGHEAGIGAEFVNALRLEDISCTNCEFGIFLFNVDDVLLNNVVSYKNAFGLILNNVADLLAQSCLFNDNEVTGVVGGFESIGLFNSEFVNCIANSNGEAGFAFSGSSNVVLRDCFASHNQSVDGFIITGASMNICLYDCYAKSNSGNGFSVSSDSTVLMRNCTAISNTNHGFSDAGTGNQYYANYACNNTGGNYSGVTMAPVTSPANARDFSNVSCNSPDVDQITAIFDCQMCGG